MSVWRSLPPLGNRLVADDEETVAALLGPEDQDGLDERADRDDLAAYRRARRRARARRLATGAAGLIGLAVVWQIIATFLRDPVLLPSVTQTVSTFAHYIDRPYPSQGSHLWYEALTSLRRILIGFAIGVVAGVTLGSAMSASRVVRHLIDPVIEVLRPLPPLAFIPLFIIWFGIGELPKVVLIVIGVTRSWRSPASPRSTRCRRTCGCAPGRSARPASTPCCTCSSGPPPQACQASPVTAEPPIWPVTVVITSFEDLYLFCRRPGTRAGASPKG